MTDEYLKAAAYVDEDSYTSDDLSGKERVFAEPEILQNTIKQINQWYTYWSDNIANFRNDLMFLYIDQWDPALRSIRTQKKKTVLQVNYIRSMVEKLIGEESQFNPDLIVSPPLYTDSQKDDVEVREGILRQSMYENKFKQAKTTALRYSLSGGYGALLVSYDYESPYTFDKKYIYKAFNDPTVCFWDYMSEEVDKSDSDICGFFTSMDHKTFHMQFPEATSDLSFTGMGDYNQYRADWVDGKNVRVADVWRREKYIEKIVLLSTGESMTKKEAMEKLKQEDSLIRKLKKQAKMGMPVDPRLLQKSTIEREEDRVCYKIIHYKMVMDEILEYGEWPSDLMPLVFLDCASIVQDGMQRTMSWHRVLQDRQRQLNYMASAECDALMMSHQGNWLGTPKNFDEKVLKHWLSPQIPNGILVANRDEKGEMPTYIPPPAPSPAFAQQQQNAIRDIYNMSGYHDANLGMGGNEQSGKAIGKREEAGNLASFMPFENLKAAIEQCGRIALSLMPAIFDYQRPIMIRTKDGKSAKKILNQPYLGDKLRNDMSLQGFGVNIETGASFAAQKQADLEKMMVLIQSNPALAPIMSDKLIENMDLDNTRQIMDRIQQFMVGIPLPEIIAKETGIKPPPAPPNPAAMMAMQQFQLEQKKVQNESDKIALQSQQMVQDAINDHAKNVIEVKKFNTEIQADMIKKNAEIERARIDSGHEVRIKDNQHKIDLFKHLNPQAKPKENRDSGHHGTY